MNINKHHCYLFVVQQETRQFCCVILKLDNNKKITACCRYVTDLCKTFVNNHAAAVTLYLMSVFFPLQLSLHPRCHIASSDWGNPTCSCIICPHYKDWKCAHVPLQSCVSSLCSYWLLPPASAAPASEGAEPQRVCDKRQRLHGAAAAAVSSPR